MSKVPNTYIDSLIENAGIYYDKALRYERDGDYVNAYTYQSLFANTLDSMQKLNVPYDATWMKWHADYAQAMQTSLTKILGFRNLVSNLGSAAGGGNGGGDEVSCTDINPLSMTGNDCKFFDDIAGMSQVKEQLKNSFINPQKFPKLFGQMGKGLLLYGPPGVGKTFIIKAAVNELARSDPSIRVSFFAPTAGELKGKYFGESEKKINALFTCATNKACECMNDDDEQSLPPPPSLNFTDLDFNDPKVVERLKVLENISNGKKILRDLFKLMSMSEDALRENLQILQTGTADQQRGYRYLTQDLNTFKWFLSKNFSQELDTDNVQIRSISIIFIDEFESVARSRDSDETGLAATTVNAFLQAMDGIASSPNVAVIAATNYPWQLDSAILRRFQQKIFIDLPNSQDTIQLINFELNKHVSKFIGGDDSNSLETFCDNRVTASTSASVAPGASCQNKCIKKPSNIYAWREKYGESISEHEIAELAARLMDNKYSPSDITRVCNKMFELSGTNALKNNVFERKIINGQELFVSTSGLSTVDLNNLVRKKPEKLFLYNTPVFKSIKVGENTFKNKDLWPVIHINDEHIDDIFIQENDNGTDNVIHSILVKVSFTIVQAVAADGDNDDDVARLRQQHQNLRSALDKQNVSRECFEQLNIDEMSTFAKFAGVENFNSLKSPGLARKLSFYVYVPVKSEIGGDNVGMSQQSWWQWMTFRSKKSQLESLLESNDVEIYYPTGFGNGVQLTGIKTDWFIQTIKQGTYTIASESIFAKIHEILDVMTPEQEAEEYGRTFIKKDFQIKTVDNIPFSEEIVSLLTENYLATTKETYIAVKLLALMEKQNVHIDINKLPMPDAMTYKYINIGKLGTYNVNVRNVGTRERKVISSNFSMNLFTKAMASIQSSIDKAQHENLRKYEKDPNFVPSK